MPLNPQLLISLMAQGQGQGQNSLQPQGMNQTMLPDKGQYGPSQDILQQQQGQFQDIMSAPNGQGQGQNLQGQQQQFNQETPGLPMSPNGLPGMANPVGQIANGGIGTDPMNMAMQQQGQPGQAQQQFGFGDLFKIHQEQGEPNMFLKLAEGYNRGGLMGALGYAMQNFPNPPQRQY